MLDYEFLQTQCCPTCDAPLVADEDHVYCVSEDCRRRFPVKDRFPILLEDQGTTMHAPDWEQAMRRTR